MTAALSEAVGLYRADFLKDLFVSDSAEFEEWAEKRRAALQQQQLANLSTLTEQKLATGDYERAKPYARRQLALVALREPAYGQLMIALAGPGNSARRRFKT